MEPGRPWLGPRLAAQPRNLPTLTPSLDRATWIFISRNDGSSRRLSITVPGDRPYTLLDYFEAGPLESDEGAERQSDEGLTTQASSRMPQVSPDWLLMIDESHVTLPQLRAMYEGDQQRKKEPGDSEKRTRTAEQENLLDKIRSFFDLESS